jgi:hypothetical protein
LSEPVEPLQPDVQLVAHPVGKTEQTRTASVIGYLKVYCRGQADTSVKQRIVVPISPVTGNAKLLLPYLERDRKVRSRYGITSCPLYR